MDKIKVNVCLGTTCFVKDGANLQELNKIVPEKYGDAVEVIGGPCLGLCSIKLKNSKPPYVKVNDIIIEEANVDKVLSVIEDELNKHK